MSPEEISAGALAAQVVGSALSSAASGTTSALVDWVRDRFHSSTEFERVEDAPDSPSRVHALGQLIDTEAADDAVMRSELQQLLEALKDCEPTVVQQAIGNQNVTANNSTVTITFPSASTTPEQPPMQSRWVRGDLYEVVYAGSGTARGVEVSPAVEGMMFRLQDTVPQDLQIGEGISFSFLRYPGVDGDRVVVSWTTDAGEQRSTKLRVPRRLDR